MKQEEECRTFYVTVFGKPVDQYSHLRTFLLSGNSTGPTAKIEEITTIGEEAEDDVDTGEDAKTVYVNDSTNLDTIPFDTKNIIQEMSDEDIEMI